MLWPVIGAAFVWLMLRFTDEELRPIVEVASAIGAYLLLANARHVDRLDTRLRDLERLVGKR